MNIPERSRPVLAYVDSRSPADEVIRTAAGEAVDRDTWLLIVLGPPAREDVTPVTGLVPPRVRAAIEAVYATLGPLTVGIHPRYVHPHHDWLIELTQAAALLVLADRASHEARNPSGVPTSSTGDIFERARCPILDVSRSDAETSPPAEPLAS